jgi:hypothetical protein
MRRRDRDSPICFFAGYQTAFRGPDFTNPLFDEAISSSLIDFTNGRAVAQSDGGSQFPLAAPFEMSVLSTFHLTRQVRTLMGVSITVILQFFCSWV